MTLRSTCPLPGSLLLLLLPVLALVVGCAAEPTVAPADLVLRNGKIITLDDTVPEAQAVAVQGAELVAVGSEEEIAPYIGPETEVIDLAGNLAIPGFIESHGHFMGLGDSRIQLDLRGADSWQAIVDQVAAAVAGAEPGTWIRGRGWHQDKWREAPTPNIEGLPLHDSLSAVSPENPVLLTHASGHASMVNATAMAVAGIDGTTLDPPGGEILHDDKGQPTGFLRETAQGLIHQARGGDGPSPAEVRRMAELASDECLAKGVTTFHDAGSSFETVDFLRQAVEEGWIGVRLWVMIRDSNPRLAEKLAAYKVGGHPDNRFTVGGIKLSIDGALGARGAWLLAPYSDSPESIGLNLVPLEDARETAALAIEHGYQLCIHAIGDRANREVLDLYAETFAAHPEKSDLRWRIEHAQHLHLDDIDRFAALGVIASMQAVHCTSDGPWVPDRLGDQRTEEGAYVWRKLMDAGALVTNGTDTPVEDVSPIESYYSSVSRRLPDGTVFYPAQRMTRLEALRTYTLNGAQAVFEEDIKGSLSVGKLADIVVLSRDILTIPEEEIPDTEVLYTLVGGEVAYRSASAP